MQSKRTHPDSLAGQCPGRLPKIAERVHLVHRALRNVNDHAPRGKKELEGEIKAIYIAFLQLNFFFLLKNFQLLFSKLFDTSFICSNQFY